MLKFSTAAPCPDLRRPECPPVTGSPIVPLMELQLRGKSKVWPRFLTKKSAARGLHSKKTKTNISKAEGSTCSCNIAAPRGNVTSVEKDMSIPQELFTATDKSGYNLVRPSGEPVVSSFSSVPLWLGAAISPIAERWRQTFDYATLIKLKQQLQWVLRDRGPVWSEGPKSQKKGHLEMSWAGSDSN